MIKKLTIYLLLALGIISLVSCGENNSVEKPSANNLPDLFIYTGRTIVDPLMVLVKEFEQKNNVKVYVKQGASGFLYDTLKTQKTGDIYFPGSSSYGEKGREENLMSDHVFVGYNRIALIVQKGNPKKLTADLKQLTDPNLSVVLGTKDSGAVGKTTRKILTKLGIADSAYTNASYFTTDSRELFNAIKNKKADLTMNWFAVSKWKNADKYLSVILLDSSISKPKKLALNLLNSSQNKALARSFMDYASSPHGIKTFYEHGFLTDIEFKQLQSRIE